MKEKKREKEGGEQKNETKKRNKNELDRELRDPDTDYTRVYEKG